MRPEGSFLPLGSVRQKVGKLVHAWAWEGEADPRRVRSNPMRAEWPRGSGRWLTFAEVDRGEWFDARTARQKINRAQAELIDRLEGSLSATRRAEPTFRARRGGLASHPACAEGRRGSSVASAG